MSMENTWKEIIDNERSKDYFVALSRFIAKERQKYTIYPPKEEIFTALKLCEFDKVKVVIIGQDPYHEPNQAHGLAFSVKNNDLPPSLVNIFKEIEDDLKIKCLNDGNLTRWAKQGVLLLNTTLTVRRGQANSHKDSGWQIFTKTLVEKLSKRQDPIVFLLWGANAIAFKNIISPWHYVLTAPHPSPLSAYRGFFGCKHFSKTNQILEKLGKQPINWQ